MDNYIVLKQGDIVIIEGEKLIITLDHNNEFSLAPVDRDDLDWGEVGHIPHDNSVDWENDKPIIKNDVPVYVDDLDCDNLMLITDKEEIVTIGLCLGRYLKGYRSLYLRIGNNVLKNVYGCISSLPAIYMKVDTIYSAFNESHSEWVRGLNMPTQEEVDEFLDGLDDVNPKDTTDSVAAKVIKEFPACNEKETRKFAWNWRWTRLPK